MNHNNTQPDKDKTVIPSSPTGEETVISQPPPGDETVLAGQPPEEALQFSCTLGRDTELATEISHCYALLRIASPGRAPGARMPVNLCLLIDRSGSMEGEPLEYAKQACSYVVDSLQPDDLLSIVCFDDRIDVIMPTRRVVNKELIKQHIAPIMARGTTNIYEAIAAAGNQAASVAAGGRANRIILLTDGAPTAGPQDQPSIVGQAQRQRERRITVSTLGFGIEYNEELLAGIARVGRGNHYYISSPELLPEVFRSEMGSILTLAASDLNLELRLSRWVQGWQVFGKQAEFGQRFISLPLPDFESGTSITTLVEVLLHPRPGGQYRIAQAILSYEDYSAGGATKQLSQDMVVNFVTDKALVPSELHPDVSQELQVASAAKSLEQTMVGIKDMQLSQTQAIDELTATRQTLLAQGREFEATQIDMAIQGLKGGKADPAKTLMAALYNLEAGKRSEKEDS